MRWELVERDGRKALLLRFEDEGPGIVDLELALTDGWTSGSGIAAARCFECRMITVTL